MVYISNGNRRMNIPTFSLISKHTCPNSTALCKHYCYAKKAEVYYSHSFLSRLNNTFCSLKDTFVQNIISEISKKKCNYLRIHESGDFYSQEYLEKWFEICKAFPKVTFLVYTQMYNLDWSKKPKNIIRYWSIWSDSKDIPKDGLKAYVVDKNGRLPIYQFPINGYECKKGKGSSITCEVCLHCFKGLSNVIFHLH